MIQNNSDILFITRQSDSFQYLEGAIGLFLVLHEDGITDLDKTAAVTIGVTLLTILWIMGRAKVVKDLAIGTNWLTWRHFVWRPRARPPVFFGVVVVNMIVGQSQTFPDFVGFFIFGNLIVALKKGNVQFFFE